MFKPMLAASEIPTIEQLTFPLMASYKLDGVRCVQIDGVAVSRKLLPIPNRSVQAWAKQHSSALHGLDGELVIGSPHSTGPGDDVFNRTSGALRREVGEPDFTYYVFEQFNSELPAYQRYLDFASTLLMKELPRVIVLNQRVVTTSDELLAYAEEARILGYEGLILKSCNNAYKFGRSTLREGTLLKWKEFCDAECEILEVIQGQENGNVAETDALGHTKRGVSKAGMIPLETMGSFRVRDLSGRFGEFYCSTGSLTDADLVRLWQQRDQLPGKVFTYTYQKVGSLTAPRFPQYKGWRESWDRGSV